MFNPAATVIDAFVERVENSYRRAFPKQDSSGFDDLLGQTARMALETLVQCDCSYHDVDHTILVTDAGQSILYGRLISQGDVSPHEWTHAIMAMLFHDIGFRRGLLREDTTTSFLINDSGDTVTPPSGATDAFMTPYHVSRGKLFVQERFATDPAVDVSTICQYIEMTRFPVPEDGHYESSGSFAGLVRAADLIGQMADPLYIQKLPRLYAEFAETSDNDRLGYDHPEDLRTQYPVFFSQQVEPYIGPALNFLRKTQEGNQWIANLYRHVYVQTHGEVEPRQKPKKRKVEMVDTPSIAIKAK